MTSSTARTEIDWFVCIQTGDFWIRFLLSTTEKPLCSGKSGLRLTLSQYSDWYKHHAGPVCWPTNTMLAWSVGQPAPCWPAVQPVCCVQCSVDKITYYSTSLRKCSSIAVIPWNSAAKQECNSCCCYNCYQLPCTPPQSESGGFTQWQCPPICLFICSSLCHQHVLMTRRGLTVLATRATLACLYRYCFNNIIAACITVSSQHS